MRNSAKVIVPYSGAHLTSDNNCKLFFRCLDASGTLTDSASTAVWTSANLSYDSSLQTPYTNMVNADSVQALSSGSFNGYVGSKVIMSVIAGKTTATAPGVGAADLRVAIGKADAGDRHGIWFAPQTFHFLMHFAAANAGVNVNTVIGNDTNFFIVAIYQPGSGMTTYSIYSIDGTELLASTDTGNATIDDFTPEAFMRFSGMKMYGMAIRQFTSLPADWLTGANWEANSWMNGDRYLYPRWKGLA